jgi:hypothetical protein
MAISIHHARSPFFCWFPQLQKIASPPPGMGQSGTGPHAWETAASHATLWLKEPNTLWQQCKCGKMSRKMDFNGWIF